jgi:hypothetical protein
MARVEANDRQILLPQLMEQPGRERAGLQADADRDGRVVAQDGGNTLRLGGTLETTNPA